MMKKNFWCAALVCYYFRSGEWRNGYLHSPPPKYGSPYKHQSPLAVGVPVRRPLLPPPPRTGSDRVTAVGRALSHVTPHVFRHTSVPHTHKKAHAQFAHNRGTEPRWCAGHRRSHGLFHDAGGRAVGVGVVLIAALCSALVAGYNCSRRQAVSAASTLTPLNRRTAGGGCVVHAAPPPTLHMPSEWRSGAR
jgi:hypothetical protein